MLRNRRIRNLRCSRSLKNPEEMMAIRIVMKNFIFEVKLWSLKNPEEVAHYNDHEKEDNGKSLRR